MTTRVQIYVSLLDEGVDVWRPVEAEHVDGDLYRITEQPYDSAIETWEFEPGSRVRAVLRRLADGEHLVAVSAA